jgi:hypothetical protein
MTATTIRVQMAQRKDTAANWTAANPILLSGEIGYETDTKKFKIGNGSTAWNSLAYLPIPDGSGNLTITGNLEIGSTGSLTFEGSTADGFETTLAVTNPTADRTITLPDVTGTVVTTGDTGSVTSTMIANGTIVDADVSSTAEIAVSKLANGTANQVIVTDGTNVSWSDNLTLAGDLTVNGTTTTINTQDLLVEDKNIIIGNVATPSDVTADGGGITLKGTSDKTINWVDATDAWTLSEHVNIASGKEYRIAGTKVLDATSLGSSILITSANITDGTIVDGDISATAEIAVSKLADGTARQLLQTDAAGTGVEWASNIDIPGTLDVTGAATLDSTLSVPLGSAGSPSIYPGTDTNTGIYSPGADQLAISTGGTGRLFVNSDGRVTVGAADANDATFEIGTNGTGNKNAVLDLIGDTTYADYGLRLIRTNSGANAASRIAHRGTGPLELRAQEAAPVIFYTNNSEVTRIRADGMFEVKGAGTAGSSPAFSVSGSAPANSALIDSGGRLLLGSTSAIGTMPSGAGLFMNSSAAFGPQYIQRNTSADVYPNYLIIDKARAAAAVTNNDQVMSLQSRGFDATNYIPIASIDTYVDGAVSTNSVPGRIVFSTNNATTGVSPRMTIKGNGNVGIGTTSPSTKFEVIDTNTIIKSSSTSGYAAFYANAATGNAAYYFFAINGTEHARISATNNDLIFGNGSTGLEKARIDSSGRLLVGTSSAYGSATLLELHSSTQFGPQLLQRSKAADAFPTYFIGQKIRNTSIVQSGDGLASFVGEGYDGASYIAAARIDFAVDGTPGSTAMPGRLVFSTNSGTAGASPTERMRITSGGYLKASNTGSGFNATATYHEIVGSAGSGSQALNITNTNATGNVVQINSNNNDTTYFYLLGYSTSAPGIRVIIWSNGNIVNTNNSYGAISDLKLKENIVDANSQWDDIKALQVRNYNFKEGQTHTQIGLIAQEVELVSPGLVSESPDRDAEGNDLGTVTKSVNYSVLYMKAVKALQEAMERIETLEAKVAALEAQ